MFVGKEITDKKRMLEGPVVALSLKYPTLGYKKIAG